MDNSSGNGNEEDEADYSLIPEDRNEFLEKPTAVRPRKELELVGSVMQILDGQGKRSFLSVPSMNSLLHCHIPFVPFI